MERRAYSDGGPVVYAVRLVQVDFSTLIAKLVPCRLVHMPTNFSSDGGKSGGRLFGRICQGVEEAPLRWLAGWLHKSSLFP